MDFLSQMVNDARFHEDEVLLLALLQAVEPKVVTTSLGDTSIEELIEALRARVEKNISSNIQRAAEKETDKLLGKTTPSFSQLFGL